MSIFIFFYHFHFSFSRLPFPYRSVGKKLEMNVGRPFSPLFGTHHVLADVLAGSGRSRKKIAVGSEQTRQSYNPLPFTYGKKKISKVFVGSQVAFRQVVEARDPTTPMLIRPVQPCLPANRSWSQVRHAFTIRSADCFTVTLN